MNNAQTRNRLPEETYVEEDRFEDESEDKQTITRGLTVSNLLRNIGAIAVLISLFIFLSKGWAGGNDLMKYGLLLSSTIGISGIALLIAHFIKEGKGPRLLLTLGLVSVPVNFAILGAFIFYGASDYIGINYPGYLAWTVDSLSTALVTTGLSLLALIPVIWLGFRTLARGMSTRMTNFLY